LILSVLGTSLDKFKDLQTFLFAFSFVVRHIFSKNNFNFDYLTKVALKRNDIMNSMMNEMTLF